MASQLTSELNEINSDNCGKLVSAIKLNTTKKVAKTNAQRQREFQQRKRNERKSTKKKTPKTNAEHQKAYRERQKMKKNENKRERRSSPYSSNAPTLLEMGLNESSSSQPVDIKPFTHNPCFALNATPLPALDPKPPSIQNEDGSSSNAFTADENSSYFQFFCSIYSDFLELSPNKQRQFKIKCLDYLYELLVEEDNSHQSHGYSHQDNVSNSSHMSEEEKDVKPVIEDGYIVSSN